MTVLARHNIPIMAVAEPVDVGARFSMPERARRRSDFLVLGMSTNVFLCGGSVKL